MRSHQYIVELYQCRLKQHLTRKLFVCVVILNYFPHSPYGCSVLILPSLGVPEMKGTRISWVTVGSSEVDGDGEIH